MIELQIGEMIKCVEERFKAQDNDIKKLSDELKGLEKYKIDNEAR